MNSQLEPTDRELTERQRILKGQADAEGDRLQKLQQDCVAAEQSLADANRLLADQRSERKQFIKDRDATVKELDDKLKESKRLVKETNDAVAERTAYLREQEHAVNTAVDELNAHIREVGAELSTIGLKKDDALRELADLNAEKSTTEDAISSLKGDLESLETFRKDTVAKIRVEVRELQGDKQRADMNLKKVTDDAAAIVKKLAAKEQELSNREQILNEREAQQSEEAEHLRRKHSLMAGRGA